MSKKKFYLLKNSICNLINNSIQFTIVIIYLQSINKNNNAIIYYYGELIKGKNPTSPDSFHNNTCLKEGILSLSKWSSPINISAC